MLHNVGELTDQSYWEGYWQRVSLPLEIKKTADNLYLNEILNKFDEYFPRDSQLSALEIGGSPGQYLVYLYKEFGYKISCLDFSSVGCEKTRENFAMLDVCGSIYKQNLFSDHLNLPLFDIVFSLGFIEHFTDLSVVIEKHLQLMKPTGTLLIGAPNFLGINRFFLSRLAPRLLSKHNLSSMDISNWKIFEEKFNLKAIFKGYVGGFEPSIFNKCEHASMSSLMLKSIAHILDRCLRRHHKWLRKFNSKYTSGYVLGIYRKSSSSSS